ncbi:MAG: alpha/beta family hydrolase [Parvibaculaceae bacterium]
MIEQALHIEFDENQRVSALLDRPEHPIACFVFAHGAGAGMTHSFMSGFARELAARNIACLRYQFPYMEARSKRPDRPALAHATVRAAAAKAAMLFPDVRLIAGGKSFGGRMTSQAQAEQPLPHVRGLAFLGFPLHPASKPSRERADHLAKVKIPMLFLQGTKDTLAELDLLKPAVAALGKNATLKLIPESDHSFHVPARTGRRDADILKEIADIFASWTREVTHAA